MNPVIDRSAPALGTSWLWGSRQFIKDSVKSRNRAVGQFGSRLYCHAEREVIEDDPEASKFYLQPPHTNVRSIDRPSQSTSNHPSNPGRIGGELLPPDGLSQ